MLFFREISSQNCDQLQSKLQKANRDNFNLLSSHMGSAIPLQCIRDITDFLLEASEEDWMNMDDESHVANAKQAIKEILQQIDLVFKKNHTELAWDEDSLRGFHIGLDQQIEMLETCGNAEMERVAASPRDQKLQLTRLRIKRYFQRLSDFLKNKEHSLCAWEIVQIQVKECFELINRFIQRIPFKGIAGF
ncbi:interferon kappa-like [Candoia aspera]|uniref:interferon kappa-like n=1 Tax=Candoia aspera TaxID=51853 RepID=UPI002FD875DD